MLRATTVRRPASPARPRGFALLLVLIMMVIMIPVVVELLYQAGIEQRAAVNVTDLTAIEYAIDGQLEVVLGTLRYDKRQNDVDAETDEWASDAVRTRRDDEVGLSTRVFDEQGKLNLLRLVQGSDPEKARAREVLVRLLDGFREGIAEEKRKGGDVDQADAEDLVDRIKRYLERQGATGEVPKPKLEGAFKDAPFLLDELLFVETAEPGLMAVLLHDVRTKEAVAPGLHRYLTVYGTKKVNLNTAPAAVLKALFSQPADRELGDRIVERRRSAPTAPGSGPGTPSPSPAEGEAAGNPYTDVNQLTDGSVQGLTAEVLQRNGIDPAVEFDVKSDVFSIRVQGATERTQRDELYVVERVRTEGFRFFLHQERTDPLLETEDDRPAGGS